MTALADGAVADAHFAETPEDAPRIFGSGFADRGRKRQPEA